MRGRPARARVRGMSPSARSAGPPRAPHAAPRLPASDRGAARSGSGDHGDLRRRSPDVDAPSSVAGRRRRLVIAVLLAGAAAAPASATAATYTASAGAVAKETWTYRTAQHPKPCANWTQADGVVRVRAYASGPFRFQRVRGVGAVGGLTDAQGPTLNVSRNIDWRIHATTDTPDCVPCGPLSEFGACKPAIADVVGAKDCRPNPGEGAVIATFDGGTLVTAPVAPSAEILRNCTVGIPHGVPLGSPEPKLLAMRFRGAADAVRRLEVGGTKRFRRVLHRGTGCKRRAKTDMSSCTRHETSVTVRRTE